MGVGDSRDSTLGVGLSLEEWRGREETGSSGTRVLIEEFALIIYFPVQTLSAAFLFPVSLIFEHNTVFRREVG